MIFVYLLLILIFSFFLIKATDILVINLKNISQRTKVGQYAITTVLLAFATSLPELTVALVAAVNKESNLVLGNIIGSNIANLSLVIGMASLIGGSVVVKGEFLKRDVFYAFLAGSAPMLLLFDKNLSRLDGVILIILYGFYNITILRKRQKELAEARDGKDGGFIHGLIDKFNHKGVKKDLAWIFLGVALLLFSADIIVKSAMAIAQGFNIPVFLIGLFLVSAGTTLPEFAFSLKAIKSHQPKMVFGDLLGSIVANGTFIVGIAAIVSPIRIVAFEKYLLATFAFVVLFGLFYFFIKTKHKLQRWEGALLVFAYLVFVILELLKA
ncbi:MAG: calcium/sodium antiporter [Patescibacteria group bacterium]|nr:calcium/sodium antiporter [Patescibacteria group bacterium]